MSKKTHNNKMKNAHKRVLRYVKERIDGLGIQGQWSVLLIVFFVGIVIALVGNFYMFVKINGDEIFKGVEREQNQNVITIDRTQLEETLLFFEARSRRFDALREAFGGEVLRDVSGEGTSEEEVEVEIDVVS